MKIKKIYTKEQEKKVIELFTRPLREGELIVDNSNKTISKETGIHHQSVNQMIERCLDEKFRILNFKINSK